ncbi:hypothetical protein GPL21_32695 [Bradyrhizobium pachyrhizi]|uniref:Uncharacterized protein n=1 Tax=Bradyrhizobium pachyrhizi TaxID=280333 RepID=A0A844SV25_9BRAD|nr:hypothetical protein [Bradyrhizobium pachyrhizi]MVT69846.1 hypothetical protein [Bradyrhizobium pachyrhizi]
MSAVVGTSSRQLNPPEGFIFPSGKNPGRYDSAAENLRLAAALEAGAEMTEADRQAAAEALRRASLVLIPTKPGQRSASTRIAQVEHQRLLRTMAATFYAGQSASAAADGIALRLARYRAGPDWKRDRTLDSITYRATLRGHCWAVLKAIDRPLSARRIRALLATS